MGQIFLSGFLGRLRRDIRGNTLALIAAAMMPLIGLIGGGVDMSRLYLTKSRIQQACDAGALAGRKAMAAGAWTTGVNSADAKANAMFTGNFLEGDYGTGTLTKSFSESGGVVSGAVTVDVPMTLMRAFGMTSRALTVNCSAKMELPNTDVMFVLDVTGSMNCVAGDASCSNNGNVPAPGSKILGLKRAVKCFYEALVKVNTTEVCGGDPTATTSTSTAQVRIGFMPYSVNVNVGKLLPNSYFANNWTYQSRTYSSSTKNYTYKPVSFNVGGFKAGGSVWNNTTSLAVGSKGAAKTVTWDGCIEERQTYQNTNGTSGSDWDPIPSSAYDMKIDMLPVQTDAATLWGPMLDEVVWGRYSGGYNTTSNVVTSDNLSRNVNYYCPVQASRLTIYNTAPAFETYVDSLSAIGNTYHDIGMLWGARFLSPTGIFASDNAATPTGGQIQRHLIFMTDGDTKAGDTDYTAYGAAYWDRRQTSYDPSETQLGDNINGRLTALCSAIKNMNITLWVISYGGGINAATETRLQNCATSGRYYTAADNAALLARFKSIASDIYQLRLTN